MDNILIKKKPSELVTPETINFTELVKNSNTTFSLSDEYQTNMIKILNDEFTEQQQQWYIANLYIFMHYHPTNDYPINLENVFKMIGFANKGNAMKTIKSNFIKDEDYKLLIIPREKKQNAGRSEHEIMLNVDTFKNLCMLAKTDKGKEIRKYYVKLENIHNKIVKEEIEQQKRQLKEKDLELENTKKQLETKTKLAVKKWYEQAPGDMVYGVKSNKDDPNSLITIGKTKNIKRRESDYHTCNQESEMFYIKRCYNCDLAEKVIHHILDKYREEKDKEWFQISEELAKYTIDMVCDFLDSFIDCSEELINLKVNEKLSICIEQANIIKNSQNIKKDNKEKDKHDKNNNKKYNKDTNIKNNIDDTKSIENFIKECCIIDKDAKCISFELLGAYRIWLRGCSLDSRKKLTQYMRNNYESKTILYENYDETEILTYLGIQPKEYIVQQENPDILPKYEEFVLKECKVGYTYRIRWTEFIETYTKWSGNDLSKEEKVNMEAYINRHFLKDRINMTGHKNVPGIWGLQLKCDNSFKVGANKSNRKQIIKVNIETNEIIEKYNGLVFASRQLNIDNRKLSNYIISKKIFDIDGIKFIYKYI